MKLIKIKRKFLYQGITLKICLVEEQYMNSEQPVQTTKVVAPNGGFVPIEVRWKETLKSIQARSIEILDEIRMKGADVLLGLTQEMEHCWTDEDFDRLEGALNTFTNFLNQKMGERGYGKGELGINFEQCIGRTEREVARTEYFSFEFFNPSIQESIAKKGQEILQSFLASTEFVDMVEEGKFLANCREAAKNDIRNNYFK